MNILILSSSTGGGHNAAGEAVKEELLRQGHGAELLDIFSLSSDRTANTVGQTYIKIASHLPWFFGFLYKIGGALGRLLVSLHIKSPVYCANSLMAKPLRSYLDVHAYDAIVMPHLFPAETITYMKRKNMLEIPAVAITTDYTCIPFWEETECDYYILPHRDLLEEYESRGLPTAKLKPYGIPVREDFVRPRNTAAARERLHLPADCPLYLIMSGSMGFGKIHLFTYELSRKCKKGEQIVIICGNNKKLRRTLKKTFFFHKNIHVIGYTEHVADYMDACNVIYTKPGGLTSTEALVKQMPIVHTAPIPGCETRNREFFVSRGMSVAAEHIRTQIAQGRMLVEQDAVRDGMKQAQKSNSSPNAARDIVSLLLSLKSGGPS